MDRVESLLWRLQHMKVQLTTLDLYTEGVSTNVANLT